MSDEQAALAAAIREIKSRSASYGVDDPDDDYLAGRLTATGWIHISNPMIKNLTTEMIEWMKIGRHCRDNHAGAW